MGRVMTYREGAVGTPCGSSAFPTILIHLHSFGAHILHRNFYISRRLISFLVWSVLQLSAGTCADSFPRRVYMFSQLGGYFPFLAQLEAYRFVIWNLVSHGFEGWITRVRSQRDR